PPPPPPPHPSSSPSPSSSPPSPRPSPAPSEVRRLGTSGTWRTRRRRARRRSTTTSWWGAARRGARSPPPSRGPAGAACCCSSAAARPPSSRRSPRPAASSGRSRSPTPRPTPTRPRRPSAPRTASPTCARGCSAAAPPSTPASTPAPTPAGSTATGRSGAEVPDWDMRLVNSSYEWVEQELTFQPEVHGWQAAVRAALLEANVTPWNGFTVEHVTGTKIGATTFDASGRRHSAADLLAFARPGRLHVAVRAAVTRVIINPIDPAARRGRSRPAVAAVGVVYQDRLFQLHHALLRPGGEVILSAGTLGSPQLLLLSGVGPANDLTSLGIPVSVDAPDVGKHMFDNPRNGISIIPSVPIDHSLIQVVGIPSANGTASYLEAASYIVPVSPMLRPAGPFISPTSPLYVTMATIMEKVPGPLSEGSLWLSSPNPVETPSVRFNYFSRPEDLAQCVVGVRRVAQVLQSRTMDIFRSSVGSASQGRRGHARRDFRIVGATLPLDWSTNNTSVADFCRRTVATLWHYHGGCVVGRVVDKDFRVMGTQSLRVVDGSTFSVTPGTNPQATVMMMGRYMGLKMIAERHSRRQVNTSS
uniref:Glucose-methanol-choline oxidoreductase N-terminal domain-containing protein n=1 Tax=Aegilops tauschii subsp. strangulata TaxID=200361 RepID=A0A453T331_AEGTS